MLLQHKTAVITGGSRGIGAAIAREYAKAGCQLALLYRSGSEQAETLRSELVTYNVRVECYVCDVSDYTMTAQTFQKILKDFGQIDILVNNAGITRDKLLPMMKESDFDQVLDINLKGAFNTMKQVYGPFLKQRSGKIINISSIAGLVGNVGQANYSASKAGLIGLTKSIAKELAAKGVTCNAIAPGFIATEMTENLADSNPMINHIPMKRFGSPEDVAHLALFLASSAADYITGEVIRVDGGLAM